MQLTVRDLMNSEICGVSAKTHLSDAVRILISSEQTALFITDDEDRMIGVVKENELLSAQLNGCVPTCRLGDLATAPPSTISSGESLSEAAKQIDACGQTAIPVIDHGCFVGIIARRDVMRMLVTLEAMEHPEIEMITEPDGEFDEFPETDLKTDDATDAFSQIDDIEQFPETAVFSTEVRPTDAEIRTLGPPTFVRIDGSPVQRGPNPPATLSMPHYLHHAAILLSSMDSVRKDYLDPALN